MNIEITTEELKQIYSAGLNLAGVFVLQAISKGQDLSAMNGEVTGVRGMLELKGFVKEGQISDLGTELLSKLTSAPPQKTAIKHFAEGLHEELQKKLEELTGKKQKVLQGKYSFLCNKMDLERKLLALQTRYNRSFDPHKVRTALLRHVERSHKAGWDKVMLVEYYIMKEGTSKLITDMENTETKEEIAGLPRLIDPKTLF